MTRKGFLDLEAELKELKSVERPAIIKAIAEAREHGDLSENAEYHSAREKQSFIEGRIKELESVIGLAEVTGIGPLRAEPDRAGVSRTPPWHGDGLRIVRRRQVSAGGVRHVG